MKSTLIVFSFLMLLSCSATKEEKELKKIYITEFKFRYFASCIKNGFDNSKEAQTLFEVDNSGYAEPILGDKYLFIDSIAKITAKKIKLDSLNSIGKKAEGVKGKKVFSTCLCEYNSNWLDSIAKSEYKKNLKLDRAFKQSLNKN